MKQPVDCRPYLERVIREHLKVGRHKALGCEAMRDLFQLASGTWVPGSTIRATIRHMVMDHGDPIGSATSAPAGFYRLDLSDKADVERNCASLRSRAVKILAREAALRRIPIEEVARQGVLEWRQENPG